MQTGSVDIEDHAVVAAHDAVLLNGAVFKRCATVYAMGMQQTNAAAAVTECYEFFVQYFQEARRVGQLKRHADWMPEPAHVLPCRGAGTGLCQFGVVLWHLVGVIAAKGNQLFDDRRSATRTLLAIQFV